MTDRPQTNRQKAYNSIVLHSCSYAMMMQKNEQVLILYLTAKIKTRCL